MEIYKLKLEHYIEDKDGRHDIEEPLVVQTLADLKLCNAPVTCQLNALLTQMFDRLRHAALKR